MILSSEHFKDGMVIMTGGRDSVAIGNICTDKLKQVTL